MNVRAGQLREGFGRALRARRTAAELSQEALAERSGLHATYISLLERGRNSPSLDAIEALAAAFGVEPHTLVMEAEGSGKG